MLNYQRVSDPFFVCFSCFNNLFTCLLHNDLGKQTHLKMLNNDRHNVAHRSYQLVHKPHYRSIQQKPQGPSWPTYKPTKQAFP